MTGPAAQEPEYAELIAELAAFRDERLRHQPSDRALAGDVGVSPTTIGDWLRADRFPQQIDPLLKLVRVVRAQAERAGLAGDQAAAAVLDEQTWRRAYQAEARRRADSTRAAVEAGQGRAVLERMRPGMPLAEVVDPFPLEVHRAIGSPVAGLPVLPAYVPREHDHRLAEVVAQAAAGASRIAVLTGGSSTGKTRACWEALQPLRERDEPWRLWHPIAPTRPDAALAELADVAPYTVIWLNEAQDYLLPAPLGEQIAARLRDLLRDPRRAPVLVLATLWLDHWDTLTTRTKTDRHAQARDLLDGHRIRVPDAFTGAALDALTDAAGADPRLAEAAERATDDHVAQYLAGVPVLVSRYEDAPPATKALIHAAMDARRLGAGPHIPLAWLAEAAPGYLTEAEWNQSGDNWLEAALDYVTTFCKGIPGILTPVKTGNPRNQRNRRPGAPAGTGSGQGPLYRLADYLDQHGRHARAAEIPPIDFWTAAAAHAHRADLTALGDAAWDRGLYRDATQLHKHATTHGNPIAASLLVYHFRTLHATDPRPAQWAAAHASLDDPAAVARLLTELRGAGADEVTVLLARDPAAHASLDDLAAVAWLLTELGWAGADEQVTALIERVAAHASLDDLAAVAWLLTELQGAGADEQVTALIERVAAHASLDDPAAVARLLNELQGAGADEQVTVLLARDPAAHASLDDPAAVARLLNALQGAGADEQVTALIERVAAHASLDDPAAVARLLNELQGAGADEQVTVLLARDPAAHASLDDPAAVARLLNELRRAGADEQVTVLLARDPAAHASLDPPPYAVAQLLNALQGAGADEQVAALIERVAAHASRNDLDTVAWLQNALGWAGADEQVTALIERVAAHASLDDPAAVAQLLNALQGAEAQEQVTALAERLPAAGRFDQFIEIGDYRERFRFGREPDGSVAAPWAWGDLE